MAGQPPGLIWLQSERCPNRRTRVLAEPEDATIRMPGRRGQQRLGVGRRIEVAPRFTTRSPAVRPVAEEAERETPRDRGPRHGSISDRWCPEDRIIAAQPEQIPKERKTGLVAISCADHRAWTRKASSGEPGSGRKSSSSGWVVLRKPAELLAAALANQAGQRVGVVAEVDERPARAQLLPLEEACGVCGASSQSVGHGAVAPGAGQIVEPKPRAELATWSWFSR